MKPSPQGGGKPEVAMPVRTEIVIVGGGLTGVSLLYWLSREGLKAILLERDRLTAGASGRNAGFILTGVAGNYALAVETYGRERARAIWAFTIENHLLLREALKEHQVGYAQRGSWTIAATPPEAVALRDSEILLREDGLPGRWMSALPGVLRGYSGGLLNPDDGEVNPAAAVRALAAQSPAGSIYEGVGVTGLEAGQQGVRVHAGQEEIVADAAVLATNAYTAQLVPEIPIAPVRGQMLATSPVRTLIADRPVSAHWEFQYWRQLPEGNVLIGGYRDRALEDEVGYDEQPTARIQGYLDAHLRAFGLHAAVTHRWAGTMGFTADGLLLAGPVPGRQNLYVCAGYSGHGMGFAFHAARRLAQLLSQRTELPTWMEADRFVTTPTR